MSLKQRAQWAEPGAPEAIGAALLCAATFCAVMALVHFHTPATWERTVSAKTQSVPLTKDGLRRILGEMNLNFQYGEESYPADGQFVDGVGMHPGLGDVAAAPRVNLTEGGGTMTITLSRADALRAVQSAGISSWRIEGAKSPARSWAGVAILAYVLGLYYFAVVYPAWRRGYGLPRDRSVQRIY